MTPIPLLIVITAIFMAGAVVGSALMLWWILVRALKV